MLDIFCSQCGAYVMTYQKDGIGHLKRTYIDRIVQPDILVALKAAVTTKLLSNLSCSNCNMVIGTPMVYAKETRLAYMLNPSAFTKKIKK